MATTNPATLSLPVSLERSSSRDLAELLFGFIIIMVVLWLPTREQMIVGPPALLMPLGLVMLRRPGINALGLGWRGFPESLWIPPATVGVMVASVFAAQRFGTYHALNTPDLGHVAGYVLWTMYQQFLLQDYFMPRLTSLLTSDSAIAVAAALFAVAHLPNLSLALATLIWGAVSCALFRRYKNLYALGIAQGLLGLTFAICIPDAWHHHMRVGLGYLHYHAIAAIH